MAYLVESMLATLVVAILLCRYRLAHRKRISLSVLALSTVSGNLLAFVILLLGQEGWHAFTPDAWSIVKTRWFLFVLLFGFIAALTALPALAVTVYYHRRSENAESPSA